MIDQREPTLEELLNEPIVQQMMLRDGVRADEIHRLMEAAQARRNRTMDRHAPLAAALIANSQARLVCAPAPCI